MHVQVWLDYSLVPQDCLLSVLYYPYYYNWKIARCLDIALAGMESILECVSFEVKLLWLASSFLQDTLYADLYSFCFDLKNSYLVILNGHFEGMSQLSHLFLSFFPLPVFQTVWWRIGKEGGAVVWIDPSLHRPSSGQGGSVWLHCF